MSSSAINNENILGGYNMATINNNIGGFKMENDHYTIISNISIAALPSAIFSLAEFDQHASDEYAIFILNDDYAGYAVEILHKDDDVRLRALAQTLEMSDNNEFSVEDSFIMSEENWKKLVDEYGGSEELLNDFIKFVTTNNNGQLYNELKEAYELDKFIETVKNLSELRNWPIWLILKNWDEIDEIFKRDD